MTILFVGLELSRADFLRIIEPAAQQAQCFFLDNFSPRDLTGSVAHQLGTILYWKDYADAFALLEAVKPDKVVYVLLDSYHHFALFFAARQQRIPVVYLDHGIRFEHEIDILTAIEAGQLGFWQRVMRKSRLKSWAVLLKNAFYQGTLRKLNGSARSQALRIFLARSRSYYNNFMVANGAQLLPDRLIAYSPETLSFYRRFFSIPAGWSAVAFTGVPSLDEFAGIDGPDPALPARSLLFIDQPMHEQGLAGWTRARKIAFWQAFIPAIRKHGLHLYIKPHPWNEDCYAEVTSPGDPGVTVLKTLTKDIYGQVSFAGSFNSTLLLAFCAMENIATFCLEMNPSPLTPEFSYGITKYGVAPALHDFAELDAFLEGRQAALDAKKSALPDYIAAMLYQFDGKAKERVNQALLS